MSSSSSLSKAPVLPRLMGTWHLVYSTLDMWKNKSVPRCELTELKESDGVVSWSDTVWTNQRGWFSPEPTPKAIEATGTATSMDSLDFRWRGKGLLRFLYSDCKVLAHDPDCAEYAVVHFGPTWFTEQGVDVLTRSPEGLPEQRLAQVLATLDPDMRRVVKEGGLSRTGVPSEK